uniref:Uncharacterized protein n=1 Tax=Hordeum vulgare subsp. vulgare TaxID=112509 RepID=A0A8I7BBU2_HORVV
MIGLDRFQVTKNICCRRRRARGETRRADGGLFSMASDRRCSPTVVVHTVHLPVLFSSAGTLGIRRALCLVARGTAVSGWWSSPRCCMHWVIATGLLHSDGAVLPWFYFSLQLSTNMFK